LQGLFHPARKVREVYWRIYNRVYIYGQDSLVPFFPHIPCVGYVKRSSSEDGDENTQIIEGDDLYRRHELFVLL
jgi:hypothetical protein